MTVSGMFAGFTERQRDFLAEPRYGTVATIRPDGTPMLFTLWYDLDGDDIWFITGPGSAKIRQIERDPRVAFHVVDPKGAPYFAANGIATVTYDDTGEKRLHMATRYRGPEGGRHYVEQNPAKGPTAVVRIRIERTNNMGLQQRTSRGE